MLGRERKARGLLWREERLVSRGEPGEEEDRGGVEVEIARPERGVRSSAGVMGEKKDDGSMRAVTGSSSSSSVDIRSPSEYIECETFELSRLWEAEKLGSMVSGGRMDDSGRTETILGGRDGRMVEG
jgi:hypothetical protein